VNPGDYQIGQRVQLHPVTDAWVQGDRYGEIVKLGRTLVHVKCDASGRVRRVQPHNIAEIVT
jgi:hypothetical protein